MGIDIDAYAVDAAALGGQLEKPLWRVLLDLRGVPSGHDVLFSVLDPEPRTRYLVTHDRRVVAVSRDRQRTELTADQLTATTFLRQSTREYLCREESSYALSFFLRGLVALNPTGFVREVTSGYRRWWIGSVLATAKAGDRLPPPTFQELCGFFARILRVYDCGFPLVPVRERQPVHGSFPVVPPDDTDHWMCVFDPRECRRFTELLDLLLQPGFVFGAPPNNGPARDGEDEDWDGFVREMLGRFLAITDVKWHDLHLVTFIG